MDLLNFPEQQICRRLSKALAKFKILRLWGKFADFIGDSNRYSLTCLSFSFVEYEC